MYNIEIITKKWQSITLANIDSWYLGEDKVYRFFNDLNDIEIDMPEEIVDESFEIDGDTVFVPLNIIRKITIELNN